MDKTGRFITFEGGEGVGKSTQIKHLSGFLDQKSIAHLITREPGGSPGAEEIRDLLVTGEPGRWSVTSETLLLYAARQDLLDSKIRPALEAGAWVLCDRFVDSSYAYQGLSRGMPQDQLDHLTHMVVGDTKPDLTIVLDVDPEIAFRRIRDRKGNEDRFEKFPLAWHQSLRKAFHTIAAENKDRCVIVNADRETDHVALDIQALVSDRLFEN